MGIATIAIGDLGKVSLRDRRYDACLCDPPYGLGFMGHEWDGGVPGPELWRVCWEAMKPGAFLLAFGGTRTWDYLAQALRKAGFEYQDTLMWLYGSGFPKGLDVGKGIDRKKGKPREVVEGAGRHSDGNTYGQYGRGLIASGAPNTPEARKWDGWKSCLKPAWEPVLLVQKPIEGQIVESALEFGTGALNIDGCRIGTEGGCRAEDGAPRREGMCRVNALSGTLNLFSSPRVEGLGRYPANLLLDEEAAAMLDGASGITKSVAGKQTKIMPGTRFHKPNLHGGIGGQVTPQNQYTDEGGASRFFWVSKTSRKERGDCTHPTMKPLRLCEYLARLILPPERAGETRRLLVPFSGSGSEMLGGLKAGFEEALGVEQDGDYAITAFARLEAAGHEARFYD